MDRLKSEVNPIVFIGVIVVVLILAGFLVWRSMQGGAGASNAQPVASFRDEH